MQSHVMLEHLIEKKDLDASSMKKLINDILSKDWPDVQVAAALALLRAKGECAQEICVAAQTLLQLAHPIARPGYACADIVGTGGDGHHTINVSSIASFVAADRGVFVAKHGNVSVSSKCGSADVLAELGVAISLSSHAARKSLDEYRWCFLFAPLYHPAFKAVREVRQSLKIKTIFNILGPLINPLDPEVMLVGVYHERLLRPIAEALQAMGKKSALVVHGSGLDEITLHAQTRCALLKDGTITQFDLTPADLGLKNYPLEQFRGDDAQKNAQDFLAILSGHGSDAKTSLVAASAGALLWLAGKSSSLAHGVDLAQESLRTGSALKVLKCVQGFGHGSS